MEVRGYEFTSEDQLFLDTNIWVLYVWCARNPRDRWVNIYSTVFKTYFESKKPNLY